MMARGAAQACAPAAADSYKARGGGGAGSEARCAGGSSARVPPAARVALVALLRACFLLRTTARGARVARVARVVSVVFSEVRCCAVQLYVL